jgi:hypothetical protein
MEKRFKEIFSDDLSTEEQIQEYIKSLYEVSLNDFESMQVIEQLKQMPNSPIDIKNNNFTGYQNNPILELLKKGSREKILKDIDPTIYLSMIFATIRMVCENIHSGKIRSSDMPYELVLDLLWNGIKQ